jgi:hypothetical protein
MLKTYFKLALPHIIAVAIFAIVAIVYCKPAMEGKVLQQSDVTQWKGMAQDALNYKAKYGTTPLWTTSMFGGMPTYQITGIPANAFTIGTLDLLFTLRLPEPIGLFFLASICFYILAQILGFNSILSIVGGLAYSYATYNPIIVMVGHMTKMHAIGYLPLFIGSFILLFKKRYIIGSLLIAISTALFVQANHLQITYYGIIIVAFLSIYYLIVWIKAKEYIHILKTLGLALVAGLMGLAVNAPMLVSTYEYGKESIRGGSVLTTKDSKTTATGLNKDYAFSYSMYKSEPLVMMFPNLYGGSSDPNTVDPASSKGIEVLQQMQPQIAQQVQSFLNFYWGGIGLTAGPPYVGIIICFFAIMGLSVKSNEHRWWIAAAIIFSLMLAAGSYFISFNSFVLEHLPFYDKFRAPSMIIVIPTLLLGVMSLYGMDAMSKESDWKAVFSKYKLSFLVLGFVVGSVLYIYMTSDFKSSEDLQRLAQWNSIVNAQIKDPAAAAQYTTPANDLVNAVATDRKSLIEGDIAKVFFYILAIGILLFLAFKKIINQTIVFIAFGLLAMFDLFRLNLKYLKPESFIETTENENAFTLTPIDNALLKDKSNYRVFDIRSGVQNSFNGGAIIAYHHKTVGGYNPAKLSIYQDLIENQWYKFPNCMPTVNMMNTKYIITGNMNNDTIPNPNACGNAWFVKGVDYRKGPAEVMNQLSYFNPKDTAIIEEKDKIADLSDIQFDNEASIQLVNNDNDVVNYKSSANKKQLAIFSEVYYKLGWKAYVDNKETPIVKANYVLRGLVIPAGKHEIRFEFKPSSIQTAQLASKTSSWILWGIMIGLVGMFFYKKQSKA